MFGKLHKIYFMVLPQKVFCASVLYFRRKEKKTPYSQCLENYSKYISWCYLKKCFAPQYCILEEKTKSHTYTHTYIHNKHTKSEQFKENKKQTKMGVNRAGKGQIFMCIFWHVNKHNLLVFLQQKHTRTITTSPVPHDYMSVYLKEHNNKTNTFTLFWWGTPNFRI